MLSLVKESTHGLMAGVHYHSTIIAVTSTTSFTLLCIINFSFPSTYCGDVVNGLRHGVGTYVDKNGILTYIGEWFHGKRHGKVNETDTIG